MLRKKVVIIGAGFGGINAAAALKGASVDVILIDRTNHHLFQPLLYQVATGSLAASEIATPIRRIFRHQKNVHVLMQEVQSIDKAKRLVTTDRQQIAYDFLIVAAGARHSYFGKHHWEERAPGLKTLRDANLIREKILSAFEHAEHASTPEEKASWLTFVVVGAGPTGVELVGAIADIVRHSVGHEFRTIAPSEVKIFLVEAAPTILPGMHAALTQKALLDLADLQVSVLKQKMVTEITDEYVTLNGTEELKTRTVIWAAGNQASPILASLEAPLDRQGRVIVGADLSLPGFPEIFVIGDAAHVKDAKGDPLPAVAPAALQEGRYVGKLICKHLKGHLAKPFKYVNKGWLATIGRFRAVGSMGPIKVTGALAWWLWSVIHLLYLVSYRNRLRVGLQWVLWLVSKDRNSRII